MLKIMDVAKVIRSKNCSPFELTLDIIFKEEVVYNKLKMSSAIGPAVIAELYGVPVDNILKIIWFDPAYAVKITMKRVKSAGAPGDSDVYGAQQHAPLLDLKFNI